MSNQCAKIIIDSREKQPHSFNAETIVTKLETGDYSIEGFENQVCIERKGSLTEVYNNFTEKRFWNEMERMRDYPYRYIIFEFPILDMENFPYSLRLPKKIWSRLKITPKYLFSCVRKLEYEYQIIVLFVNNRQKSSEIIEGILARLHDKLNES